ncbi:MAG: hypothetical protein HRT68_06750 [Flavobacteriaceae bacterium]|nr:hypothetical protein [Flavobacteriaceae bacterium]
MRLLLLSLIIGLISCKQTSEENKRVKKEAKEQVISEAAFDLNEDKIKQKQSKQVRFPDIPRNYIALTEQKGKTIIFNPCDAANHQVKIDEKDGTIQIYYLEGQEATLLEVESVSKTEKGYAFGGIIYGEFYDKAMEVTPLDTAYEMVNWTLSAFDGNRTMIFTDAQYKTNYEVVDQPCKECWGDDCDDMNEN